MSYKAGQLIVGGFEGTTVTDQAVELISKYHISSMILSSKNVINATQTKQLILNLQKLAFDAGYKYPIMFAIDEEGGMLNSLFDNNQITQFPGAMALAATGDVELVYECCKAISQELKSLGFMITLGPVLDVVTSMSDQLVGVRSFGTTIEEVIKYGRAAAKGWKDGGLLTFGKHFPGIGNCSVDSLLELPMMPDSLQRVESFNIKPFQKLIQENLLDGVSVAGCAVPAISPDETHACLSPVLINQLLRNKMKFKGAVISECLEMDALYNNIGLGQGVIMAIFAGCDLVMVCHDFRLQKEALSAIEKAIEDGNLDSEIVDVTISRIEVLQNQLPSWDEIFNLSSISKSLWIKHQNLSKTAYQKSITLVRDYNNSLPISKFLNSPDEKDNNILLLTPLLQPLYSMLSSNEESMTIDDDLFPGEDVFRNFGNLLAKYKDSKYNVIHTTYTANGLTGQHENLIEKSKVVIVLTSEAKRNMYQIGIVKYISILCASAINKTTISKPLIIVAVSSPYDFFYNRNIGSTYICCYDYTENAMEHLPSVLFGDLIPTGNIPGEIISNKRSPVSSTNQANKKRKHTRRWLVDQLDMKRDWNGLATLWSHNFNEALNIESNDKINADQVFDHIKESGLNSYLIWLFRLLSNLSQKHFVVRNSSLNVLYGFCLTWRNGDVGHIVLVLVDKSKRNQSVGKNLHSRAIRYLTKELGLSKIRLGSSFPLILFPRQSVSDLKIFDQSNKVSGFLKSVGWRLNDLALPRKQVLRLNNLNDWSIPSKIFRELIIVGVRFDVCNNAESITKLIDEINPADETASDLKEIYHQAIGKLNNGLQIIVALEPSNQSVIGSIIVFTNKSIFARNYPFLQDITDDKNELIGCIMGQIIDPSYYNLTEVFKFGLICSAITFLKPQNVTKCVMYGIEESHAASIKDIGFIDWKYYYDYYDQRDDWE